MLIFLVFLLSYIIHATGGDIQVKHHLFLRQWVESAIHDGWYNFTIQLVLNSLQINGCGKLFLNQFL